jgi:hypothetical protein
MEVEGFFGTFILPSFTTFHWLDSFTSLRNPPFDVLR